MKVEQNSTQKNELFSDLRGLPDISMTIPAGGKRVPQLNYGMPNEGRRSNNQIYMISIDSSGYQTIFHLIPVWDQGWDGQIKYYYDEFIKKGFAPTNNEKGA